MNLRTRLEDLEKRLLPSQDQILLEKMLAATDGGRQARRDLEDFLMTYRPSRGCRLAEMVYALAILPAPAE
jgi:hypothetical protein